MSVARAVLVLAAGCNQLYDLDATQLRPEVPVKGHLLQRWVENDAGGMPVTMTAPLAMSSSVYLGARVGRSLVDLALDEDGGFEFVRSSETERYQLVLTIDGEIVEIQHDAPELTFVVRSTGRFDVTPFTDPLKVTVTMPTDANRVGIASTGIWAYDQRSGFAGTYDFDLPSIQRVDRPGLLDASRGDRFYYMDYSRRTTPEGDGYLTMTGAAAVLLTLNQTSPPLPFPPAPRVTGAPCTKLVGAHATDLARFQAATPGFELKFDQWKVIATPDPAVAISGAIDLAFGESFGSLGDIAATPAIYNPIPHTELGVILTSSATATIQHPNAAGLETIAAYLAHGTPLSCGAPTTSIVPPAVGIPGAITLEGTLLATNGVDVVVPSGRDLELAWESVAPGRTDWYTVVLYEVFEIFNLTGRRAARAFQTAEPRLVIDPANLVRGRYYILEITGITGLREAASGNLDSLAYPYSETRVFSSMFRAR